MIMDELDLPYSQVKSILWYLILIDRSTTSYCRAYYVFFHVVHNVVIILQDTIFKVVLWFGKDSPFVTSLDRRATFCKTQYFIFCSDYKPPGLIPLFRNTVNHIFNYNVSSLTLLILNTQTRTNGKKFLCLTDIKGCQDHLYSASLCKCFYNPSFFQYYNMSKNAEGGC